MRIGFIGAGKVGCTLGKFMSIHGAAVTGYYDRDTEAAAEAARFVSGETDEVSVFAHAESAAAQISAEQSPQVSTEQSAQISTEQATQISAEQSTQVYTSAQELIADSDLVFLTVPDGLIARVCGEISAFDIKDKFICHCSGSISSREALASAAVAGAYTYSIHPLFAVSDKFTTYSELADAFFTLEGDPARIGEMSDFLAKAGLKFQIIDPAAKTKYHLAAVYGSNLICGLIGESVQLLQECGFKEDDAIRAIAPLVRGNVEHALAVGPVQALTGPVERGDTTTLQKHLGVMTEEEDKQLYRLLSKKLLQLAKQKHPERDFEQLELFLSNDNKEN